MRGLCRYRSRNLDRFPDGRRTPVPGFLPTRGASREDHRVPAGHAVLDRPCHARPRRFPGLLHRVAGVDRAHLGDDPVAGAGPLMMPEQPPAWSWYAATTDADAMVGRVEEAGGKVLNAP